MIASRKNVLTMEQPPSFSPSLQSRLAPFEAFFARIAKLPDVLRANIYARDQKVL